MNRPNYVISQQPTAHFYGDKNQAEQETAYFGPRITSKGTKVQSFLAAKAISGLSVGYALPIYETYEGISMEQGDLLSRKYIHNPNLMVNANNEWVLVIPVINQPPQFINELAHASRSVNDNEKPLVFLVTTKAHAIIYILHEAKLYTCGYGYMGNLENIKNLIATSLRTVPTEKTYNIAHTFEELRGAIYSTDHVAPTENIEAKIAWIGFLNIDIVNRIQDFLDATLKVVYNGKIMSPSKYSVSSNSILILNKSYYAAIGFVPGKDAYNCLVWAQKMLNINIDCGFFGYPGNCKPISVVQFKTLRENLNNRNLSQIIREIQSEIELPKDICTKIGRIIGLCSKINGGKRRNKTRRNTINKTRRNIRNKSRHKKKNKIKHK